MKFHIKLSAIAILLTIIQSGYGQAPFHIIPFRLAEPHGVKRVSGITAIYQETPGSDSVTRIQQGDKPITFVGTPTPSSTITLEYQGVRIKHLFKDLYFGKTAIVGNEFWAHVYPEVPRQSTDEFLVIVGDKIKITNLGTKTVVGEIDFSSDRIEDSEEVVVRDSDAEPDPMELVAVEKEPEPLNLQEIKSRIIKSDSYSATHPVGSIIFRVLVSSKGEYVKHVVIRSPSLEVTKLVEPELKYLKFTPATQNGKPIAVWVTIPFKFS